MYEVYGINCPADCITRYRYGKCSDQKICRISTERTGWPTWRWWAQETDDSEPYRKMTALASSFRKTKFQNFFEGSSTSILRKTLKISWKTTRRTKGLEGSAIQNPRKIENFEKSQIQYSSVVLYSNKGQVCQKRAETEQYSRGKTHFTTKPALGPTYRAPRLGFQSRMVCMSRAGCVLLWSTSN